jgi:hypothetical protein
MCAIALFACALAFFQMGQPGSLRPLRTVSRKTGQAVRVSRHTAQALLRLPQRRGTRLLLYHSLGNPALQPAHPLDDFAP